MPQEPDNSRENAYSFTARLFNNMALITSGFMTYDSLMLGITCFRIGETLPGAVALTATAAQAAFMHYNFKHFMFSAKNYRVLKQESATASKRRAVMGAIRTALPVAFYALTAASSIALLSDEVKQKLTPANNPGPAVGTPG